MYNKAFKRFKLFFPQYIIFANHLTKAYVQTLVQYRFTISIKPSHFLSKVCSNKYLVVSFRIAIIHNMGSYKLYLAVIAIACIAAVQVNTKQLYYTG